MPGKQFEKVDVAVVATWKKEQHAYLEESFRDLHNVVLCEDEMVLALVTTTQKVCITQCTSPAVTETKGTRQNGVSMAFESKDRRRACIFYRAADDA